MAVSAEDSARFAILFADAMQQYDEKKTREAAVAAAAAAEAKATAEESAPYVSRERRHNRTLGKDFANDAKGFSSDPDEYSTWAFKWKTLMKVEDELLLEMVEDLEMENDDLDMNKIKNKYEKSKGYEIDK